MFLLQYCHRRCALPAHNKSDTYQQMFLKDHFEFHASFTHQLKVIVIKKTGHVISMITIIFFPPLLDLVIRMKSQSIKLSLSGHNKCRTSEDNRWDFPQRKARNYKLWVWKTGKSVEVTEKSKKKCVCAFVAKVCFLKKACINKSIFIYCISASVQG